MATIDHVVVLMLENRSFDHMLGFLEHPDPAFDGLLTGGPHTNPGFEGGPPVAATPNAKAVLPQDPNHEHDAVMKQLGVAAKPPYGQPRNDGFVADFERVGRNLDPQRFTGFLSPLVNRHLSHKTVSSAPLAGIGPLVMRCQNPANVPVLSHLALEFAVCTRWFSPVPGETWPNRNFLHAATSDGETDIDTRLYANPTIFELLEAHGHDWTIYHDDTPQVWAFVNLWDTPERHAKWHPFSTFAEHVKAGKLPAYSFIEPNHRPPLHTLDHERVIGRPDISDSQHPGNNIVSREAYDTFPDDANTDFARGETLIAAVYEALRAQPDLFARTLLIITYDEHGGFYDHVPPPQDVPAPGPARAGARLAHLILEKSSTAFDFTMLGPRVPAVLVSPLIAKGTIDGAIHDHTAVPATLRALFAPDAKPLTHRDAWAEPLHGLLTLDQPRQGDQLPDLSAFAARATAEKDAADATADAKAATGTTPDKVGDFYRDFLRQAEVVWRHLAERGGPETAADLLDSEPERAIQISKAFADAAERLRRQKS
ncbi:alkaline phosphatase family protein [Catenulispora rubra]|uniref:alkaline phosphatase family protein n=1 Tax=Catenulispora rubra TaxID=280293 RepID=UPI001891FBEF|nr:alkaline phosphatase family protein [Catenulispora rubra]